VLPGGRDVLFTIQREGGGAEEGPEIAVLGLETGRWRILGGIRDAVQPRYLNSGHLLYARGGGLFAVRFDAGELEPVSSTTPVLSGVHTRFFAGLEIADFAVSRSGSMVYVPGATAKYENQIAFLDREGGQEFLTVEAGLYYGGPQLSPDGGRIVFSYNPGLVPSDVWIQDLTRRTFTPLTTDGSNIRPVWTPDGSRVTFSSMKSGSFDIYSKLADGSAEAEPLLIREQDQFPSSWSVDGNILAFTERNFESGTDIWILHRDGETPEPFLVTAFNEDVPAFSPDGRWLAYQSDESGRYEVYAQPFPGPGRRWPISTNGGREPVWSSKESELFYRNGDSLMVVAIETDPVFTPGVPRFLFEWRFRPAAFQVGARAYDVTPDGRRFVMLRAEQEELAELNVVLNWFEQLKAKVGN
jgi:dipeptidyl aminopeptidase/acylaminoacyl peptidase